jgi:hypothetical protein
MNNKVNGNPHSLLASVEYCLFSRLKQSSTEQHIIIQNAVDANLTSEVHTLYDRGGNTKS